MQATIDEVPFEGRRLVIARITEMDLALKPCRVAGTRKAYLRVGDGDYELSQLEEDAFVVARSRRRFDEDPIPGTGVADLDSDRMNEFLANARAAVPTLRRFDDMKVLLKMGVLTKDGVATVAGLIALGEYPQQYLPAVSVRAALLPTGRSIGNVRVLDDATFNGPIASIVEDTVAWVAKNSRNEIVEDRLAGRVFDQTWPPLAAVRELVANAVVHRDLAPWSGGRAIELRMSAENFRITNPGGLYEVSVTALGRIDLTSARNRRLIDLCRYRPPTAGSLKRWRPEFRQSLPNSPKRVYRHHASSITESALPPSSTPVSNRFCHPHRHRSTTYLLRCKRYSTCSPTRRPTSMRSATDSTRQPRRSQNAYSGSNGSV